MRRRLRMRQQDSAHAPYNILYRLDNIYYVFIFVYNRSEDDFQVSVHVVRRLQLPIMSVEFPRTAARRSGGCHRFGQLDAGGQNLQGANTSSGFA